MGTFIINLQENYAFLIDGTKTKYQLQSSGTNGQSIMYVGDL